MLLPTSIFKDLLIVEYFINHLSVEFSGALSGNRSEQRELPTLITNISYYIKHFKRLLFSSHVVCIAKALNVY